MQRAVVGTAGHIDHGKTRLIEALTGIDCDRWAEEKSRGITIDLGFAHLEAGGLQMGFIDVPGHEKFLRNALAGLGGIRVMLLVVAADEGVKPQTREHLAICSLLGIPAALVALTKSDLVTPDLLELATLEIEELLAGTPFAGAPVLAVSSQTGAGIDELQDRLVDLARRHAVEPDPVRPARLPVDRAFLLKGLGLVVTGTLAAGEVTPGDVLTRTPDGGEARVRGVQVHGAGRERAVAGDRTALQLTGIDHTTLARGDQLVPAGAYEGSRRLICSFTLLADAPKPMRGPTAVRLHLLSSEVAARVRPLDPPRLEPGDSGRVEVRLGRPLVVVPSDRLVVRRPSPPITLGGGVVLDNAWRPVRGKRLTAALAVYDGGRPELLAEWVTREGEAGISSARLARRLGVRPEAIRAELDALVAEQRLVGVPAGQGHGPRWLDPAAYRRVESRAKRVLKEYFQSERLARGMSKAEAVRRILPGRGAELADVYVDWLTRRKVLTVDGGQVNLAGRRAELSDVESRLSTDLVAIYDAAGLAPPSPAEVRERTGAKPQTLEGVIGYLLERGRLLRLPGGLIISAAAVSETIDTLRRDAAREFTVGDFKSRFGLTRKWAIPLLEYLDSSGATRRVGDRRQVVR